MIESQHTTVFQRPGLYAGWPANHGLWQQADRILVGFEVGAMDTGGGFHAIDRNTQPVCMMAETTDGGQTWEPFLPRGTLELRQNRRRMTEEQEEQCVKRCISQPVPVCFHQMLVKFRMLDMNWGSSYVNYSADFGRSWHGPMLIDEFSGVLAKRRGVSMRTSYLLDPVDAEYCMAFGSASKWSDGKEGQPFVMETRDGGKTWDFLSWIDDVPHDGFGIMPSVVRLPTGSILCCVRWRERSFSRRYGTADEPFRSGIICYLSEDEGRSWRLRSIPVRGMYQSGNPPDLVLMPDGRVALVYGWREPPFGIACQWTADDGMTWTVPRLIRQGAGCHDLGYTRSCLIEGDSILSVYYWSDEIDSERYIAATAWRLD